MNLINNVTSSLGKALSMCVLDLSEGLSLQLCAEAAQGLPDLMIEFPIGRLKKCVVAELKLCARSRKSFMSPSKSPLIDAERKFQGITHLNIYRRCFKYVVFSDDARRLVPRDEIKRLEKQSIHVIFETEFVEALRKRDC